MVKGFSIRTSWITDPSFLEGFWYSSSGHGLVLWFYGDAEMRCGDETLVPGVTEDPNSLFFAFSLSLLLLMTCVFGLLSLKSNSGSP